jgi:hypothetical protein
MAAPDQLPEWATSGTLDEPNAGAKATGWLANMKPPFGWMNWWMNLVYQWLSYLNENVVPTGSVGFNYDDGNPAWLSRDVSPAAGSWTQYDGTGTPEYVSGTPRHVRSSSATNPIKVQRPFDAVSNLNISAKYVKIKRLSMLYARGDAAAQIIFRLVRQLRDGSGAVATVASVTGTGTAGTFVEKTSAADIDHEIDALYVYWFEVELDPVAAQDDARIAFASFTYEKTRVE